jgi:CRP-like cAMP-binding protein
LIDIYSHGVGPADLIARRLASGPSPYRAAAGEITAFGVLRRFEAGDDIVPAGQRSAVPTLLVGGVVGEVRNLSCARRQIVRMRLPGDVLYGCDREAVIALSRAVVVDARPFLEQLAGGSAGAGLRRAWLELTQADQDLLRDQLVRLGRMTAREAVAHILLEIHDRLRRVGLVEGETFHLPISQDLLRDAVALSGVHLNRTLQGLRRDGLVSMRSGVVTILDRAGLEQVCSWPPRSCGASPSAGGRATREPAYG